MLKKAVLIMLAVFMVLGLSACKEKQEKKYAGSITIDNLVTFGQKTDLKEAIVGTWCVTEESRHVSRSVYPERDILVFYEDGTWGEDYYGNVARGSSYFIADNKLTMDARELVYQVTYDISIENDVLTLSYPGHDPLSFKRVK